MGWSHCKFMMILISFAAIERQQIELRIFHLTLICFGPWACIQQPCHYIVSVTVQLQKPKEKLNLNIWLQSRNVYMPSCSLIHEFKLECDCDWFYSYLVNKFCVLICNCYKIKIIVRHNLYSMTKIMWMVLIVIIAHG